MRAALGGRVIVRVADLEAIGIDRHLTAYRCRPGGPWRRLLPGVVKLENGPPTRDDHRLAALIYAGERAVLSGLDALYLHGMSRMRSPSGPVHVLIPADRRRVGAGRVLVERTERLPIPAPGRWPLASVARAALDFARRSSDRDEVRATITEVVQRGRCSPADLCAELEVGSSRGSALSRAVLREIADGVRSVAEADARTLVIRSGLPQPMYNPRLLDEHGRLIAIPDVWFDEVALAWEIDSHEYHLSPEDYDRTLDRRSAMMAEGVVVMHSQPSKLRRRRNEVVDELRRNHAQAALRPRPNVVAVPG